VRGKTKRIGLRFEESKSRSRIEITKTRKIKRRKRIKTTAGERSVIIGLLLALLNRLPDLLLAPNPNLLNDSGE
jgi:hypothetical protein